MFCKIKGNEDLGYAKVIDHSTKHCLIEFFHSPFEGGGELREVPSSAIKPCHLNRNTRVYVWQRQEAGWYVGRVLQDVEDQVEVRFPNRKEALVDASDVYVRSRQPISDPTDYLSAFITETPLFAETRTAFLKNYIAQRGATHGISALLSSTIELHPHQVDVIRTVLHDPVQRYLLADEVGLGKTIEAGVIIRQAVLDDAKNHRVLVLVPGPLKTQWYGELEKRFGLGNYLDDSVVVLGFEETAAVQQQLQQARMLVVDEAHHVTAEGDPFGLYALLSAECVRIERILLLSATPVLGNEGGFLRLLHLLDPIVYPLEKDHEFHKKILHRQQLAETVAALTVENMLQLDLVLDDLLTLLPNDSTLQTLVPPLQEIVAELPDDDDPEFIAALRSVRTHLSETHRLHRRILRNRRKQIRFLTPDRAGLTIWPVAETSYGVLEEAVENWRVYAASSVFGSEQSQKAKCLAEFHYHLIRALLEAPSQLEELCLERVIAITAGAESFAEERGLLRSMVKSVQAFDETPRMEAAVAALQDVLAAPRCKVVVFCSDPRRAEKLQKVLEASLSDTVERYTQADEDEEPGWLGFHTDPRVRVLVCDHSAEEGLNLQGGDKLVLHYDLPFSPNRIEQRMGRVDRFGSGDSIRSIALLDENMALASAWTQLLDEGFGLFSRSIASLQYLVDEKLGQLEATLFDEGDLALQELTSSLAGEAGECARELKKIDEQDDLDALASEEEDSIEVLDAIDSDWRTIREDFDGWIKDMLQFNKVNEEHSLWSPSVEQPFRFQYNASDQGRGTLLPVSDLVMHFAQAIDFKSPASSSIRPLTYPYAYRRETACNHQTRLMRYGDDFVEAAKTFTDLDDRGRSWAMWRQIEGPLQEDLEGWYFRFDFVVETRLDEACRVLCEAHTQGQQTALARRADALLPPRMVSLWIDGDGHVVDSILVEKYLALRYQKWLDNGYRDTNLNTNRWQRLKALEPDILGYWRESCCGARENALKALTSSLEFKEQCDRALSQAEVNGTQRFAQLRTRITNLDGEAAQAERAHLELEERLLEALRLGIEKPNIRVDSVGAIYLSRQAFEELGRIAMEAGETAL